MDAHTQLNTIQVTVSPTAMDAHVNYSLTTLVIAPPIEGMDAHTDTSNPLTSRVTPTTTSEI